MGHPHKWAQMMSRLGSGGYTEGEENSGGRCKDSGWDHFWQDGPLAMPKSASTTEYLQIRECIIDSYF